MALSLRELSGCSGDQDPPTSSRGFWEPLGIGPEYITLGLGHPTPGVWGQARSGFRYRKAVLWGSRLSWGAGRYICKLLSCILGRE